MPGASEPELPDPTRLVPIALTVGVVLLTQGTRPAELREALNSVLDQRGVTTQIVVVGNGWDPASAEPPLPPQVLIEHVPTNLGIPAGRNAGVNKVAGEFLFFLDDDATVADPFFLAQACAMMRAHTDLGLLQPKVVDPASGRTSRQWIPKMHKDADVSGDIFSCWEGAVLMRRDVFDAVGGWAEPFFYAHEGIEMAWRVWNSGHRAWYDAQLLAHHPVIEQTRHSQYYRLNARNRVWLARRNLPAVLMPLYVGSWTLVQLGRWWRKPAALRAWFGGWREGWSSDPGGRQAMSWHTVLRMARAGRLPIV